MRYYWIILFFPILGCGMPKKSDPNFSVAEASVVTMSESESIIVEKHNLIRQQYFSDSDLRWSPTVAASAQAYADDLANSGFFGHDNSNIGTYGENLYAASYKANYGNAVDAWEKEEPYYDYNSNSCQAGKVCGHYTQIIWKKSTEIGCGIAIYQRGAKKGWTVVVCRYNPPGNYRGQEPF